MLFIHVTPIRSSTAVNVEHITHIIYQNSFSSCYLKHLVATNILPWFFFFSLFIPDQMVLYYLFAKQVANSLAQVLTFIYSFFFSSSFQAKLSKTKQKNFWTVWSLEKQSSERAKPKTGSAGVAVKEKGDYVKIGKREARAVQRCHLDHFFFSSCLSVPNASGFAFAYMHAVFREIVIHWQCVHSASVLIFIPDSTVSCQSTFVLITGRHNHRNLVKIPILKPDKASNRI